jgi:hypothetical protein
MKFKLKTISERPSEKELDSLWREAVILRDGSICVYPGCKKTEHLNAHHIYSRSRKSFRWDTENGVSLCAFHHSLGNDSAHKSPDFKRTLIEYEVRSKNFLDKLEMRAKTPAKIDRNICKLDLLKQLKLLRVLRPYKV